MDFADLRNVNMSRCKLFNSRFSNCMMKNVKFSIYPEISGLQKSGDMIEFLPNGEHIACCSGEGKLKILDFKTGTCIRTIEGKSSFSRFTFSPDGKYVVTFFSGTTMIIWNVQSGEELHKIKDYSPPQISSAIQCVKFSLDGTYFASAGNDITIKIWDFKSFTCLKTLEGHQQGVNTVTFSPDGKQLASGDCACLIKIWSTESWSCLQSFKGNADWIFDVCYSPDGKTLATRGDGQYVKIWSTISWTCLQTIEHSTFAQSIIYSKDGRYLASSTTNSVNIWDSKSGILLHAIVGMKFKTRMIRYSLDGKFLAGVTSNGSIIIWDAIPVNCLQNLEGHKDIVTDLSLSPDGKCFASASNDKTIKVWELKSFSCILVLKGHTKTVTRVRFSPDGEKLVSSSEDSKIKFWDIKTGVCLQTLNEHALEIKDLAYSNDGRYLVSSSMEETKIWDMNTLKVLNSLWSISGMPVISADSSYMAVINQFKINIWDLRENKWYDRIDGDYNYNGVRFIAYSPDGYSLAWACKDYKIRLYDTETAECYLILEGHSEYINGCSFSHDGLRLVSYSNEEIKVWDAVSGKCLHMITGHTDKITSVIFTLDDKYLISGSDDRTIKMWNSENQSPDGLEFKSHEKSQNRTIFLNEILGQENEFSCTSSVFKNCALSRQSCQILQKDGDADENANQIVSDEDESKYSNKNGTNQNNRAKKILDNFNNLSAAEFIYQPLKVKEPVKIMQKMVNETPHLTKIVKPSNCCSIF